MRILSSKNTFLKIILYIIPPHVYSITIPRNNKNILCPSSNNPLYARVFLNISPKDMSSQNISPQKMSPPNMSIP